MTNKPQRVPVTVIILTFNEEINIKRCVDALHRFDEIVVVDSGSTDRTRAILADACEHVRVFENPFEDFGQQRNWALDQTDPRHEWILFVDADEFMEDPLADEIEQFVYSPADAVGGYIAGRNYFLGRWLKRCTFFPSYQLRLLRKGKVRYRKEGHGQREVMEVDAVYFKNSWYHDAFSHGVHQWIERHNRYSTAEISLIKRLRGEPLRWSDLQGSPLERRRMLKRLAARIPGRAFARFFYTYFLRLGFLDGVPGFWFCVLRFSHECHIVVKLAESRRQERSINASMRNQRAREVLQPPPAAETATSPAARER